MNYKFTSQTRTLLISGLIIFTLGVFLLSSNINNLLPYSNAQAEIKLREAEGYLRQNSKESAREAINIFNHILAREMDLQIHQKAKYGMAVALERLEENTAALEYYRELQKQKISNIQTRNQVDYRLGRFYLYLNHEEEGSSLLHALLNRTQNKLLKSKVYTAFGMYYLRDKQHKRAEANFRVALKYNQENINAQEGRAKAVKGQGQDWRAYRYYDDYLFSTAHLNPKNRKKVLDKVENETFASGVLAFHKKRYHNAISFFKKICATSTNNLLEEKARFWIGESYRALGAYDKAINVYQSVLQNSVTDKDAVALFRKGSLLFEKNKTNKAAKVFSQLQKDYPESDYSIIAKEYLDDFYEEKTIHRELENSKHEPLHKHHTYVV